MLWLMKACIISSKWCLMKCKFAFLNKIPQYECNIKVISVHDRVSDLAQRSINTMTSTYYYPSPVPSARLLWTAPATLQTSICTVTHLSITLRCTHTILTLTHWSSVWEPRNMFLSCSRQSRRCVSIAFRKNFL